MSRRSFRALPFTLTCALAAFAPVTYGCAVPAGSDTESALDEGAETTGQTAEALAGFELFTTVIGGAKSFFEGTVNAQSEAAKAALLDARLRNLEDGINKANAQLDLIRRQNFNISSLLVRQENQTRLTALGVLRDRVRDATVKFRHLQASPNDRVLRAEVDSLTFRAVEGFLDAENDNVWRWTRDVGRESPRVKVAYPIYELAIAQRAAFLTFFHTPLEIRTVRRAELFRHAAFLSNRGVWPSFGVDPARSTVPFSLADRIREAIYFTVVPTTGSGENGSFEYTITCRENLEEQSTRVIQRLLPAQVPSVKGQLERQAWDALGGAQISTLQRLVEKLARDGTLATEVVGDFGLDYGPITHGSTAIYAAEGVANHANVTVPATATASPPDPTDGQTLFVFHRDGSIQHIASGRCLDVEGFSTSDGARVQALRLPR